MELSIRHIGSVNGSASKIIELTVIDYYGKYKIEETVTNLNGVVDNSFIQNLRDIANELEDQNNLINPPKEQ